VQRALTHLAAFSLVWRGWDGSRYVQVVFSSQHHYQCWYCFSSLWYLPPFTPFISLTKWLMIKKMI